MTLEEIKFFVEGDYAAGYNLIDTLIIVVRDIASYILEQYGYQEIPLDVSDETDDSDINK